MKPKKVVVIGGGLGGLTAASYAAQAGFRVTLLEKNSFLGGRAQTFTQDGFKVDMGPSWYWIREVMDKFFTDFGHTADEFFTLVRLSPSYRVHVNEKIIDIPTKLEELSTLFEAEEKGAGKKLTKLLDDLGHVNEITMSRLVTAGSLKDLTYPRILSDGLKIMKRINGFQSVETLYRSRFRNELLRKLLAFPIFFLGDSTTRIAAVYAIMNYVDYVGGTWYPLGGFSRLVEAVTSVAKSQGVIIKTNCPVTRIRVRGGQAQGVETCDGFIPADVVVANAEYPYVETALLSPSNRSYSQKYWQSRRLAPSSFLLYAGFNRSIPGLLHHTLFFHNSWQEHNQALFTKPVWPKAPLYYVSSPTKTDPSIAPKGHELLTILVPLAAGLPDTTLHRDTLQQYLLQDLSKKLDVKLEESLVWSKTYALHDFAADYHAYKGNAYGLGQTTSQTAIFRPRFKSRKVKNLLYTGHFTIPGIGVPMVILSGKTVARYIEKEYAS